MIKVKSGTGSIMLIELLYNRSLSSLMLLSPSPPSSKLIGRSSPLSVPGAKDTSRPPVPLTLSPKSCRENFFQ